MMKALLTSIISCDHTMHNSPKNAAIMNICTIRLVAAAFRAEGLDTTSTDRKAWKYTR